MSLPTLMRALQQTSLNGPGDLRLVADARVPAPGAGQVLVKIGAAGVNMADLSQAHGTFGGGPQPPYLAGFEGAGEVVALGAGVTGLAPGAHVTGIGYGTFAEYALFSAFTVTPVPQGWSDEQVLGLMVNWPTALAAVKYLGELAAGTTALIHAAAGGTGQIAVKLAKHYGATVIATASPEKHETVRVLGADHILDSRGSDVLGEVLRLTGGEGADLVVEGVGGAMFESSLAAARRVTGRVIVTGLPAGEAKVSNWDLVYKNQVHVIGLNIGILAQRAPQMFGQIMGELSSLIAAGVLGPGQPTVHDLADGPKALMDLESRKTVGKLALRP